jgi:catechol 2,3-dioxygenase-like lactoylglutathione lyase family enzyme
MRILKLDHVVITTADVDRLMRFYTEELGLVAEGVDQWKAGELPFPSLRVSPTLIIDLQAGTRTGMNVDHLAFVVDDLDRAHIAQRFGNTAEPALLLGAQGTGLGVYVRDPDGNRIELRTYPPSETPHPSASHLRDGQGDDDHRYHLRTFRVLSVDEDACQVWADGDIASVRFAATFPTPRVERVAPGHLVAVTSGPDAPAVVVWRWFDAVVLGSNADGAIRLWDPLHGEVVASTRPWYVAQEPGSRVFASAGLPGADWWVACSASGGTSAINVELSAVVTLYDDNNLWAKAFDLPS